MNRKRRIQDGFKNSLTYLSAGIAVVILLSVFVYVFQKGASTLSWDMLTSNYWAENVNLRFEKTEAGEYTYDGALPEGTFFSEKFGFAVKDSVSSDKKKQIEITYIDENSPLKSALVDTAGALNNTAHTIQLESLVQKFTFENSKGVSRSAGVIVNQDAETMVKTLDTSAVKLLGLYYQTTGGGILGSLKATFMLIGMSLFIALPVGIFAAIYLNELAKKNRMTAMIRSSIEMLSGVPSIVFGLMGMTVFFPITALFGATGPSIILGGMTLAVILLPVIIRQTEEALLVVPMGLRTASLSLGATETQTIFKVILPSALPGILSATLLSVSRIIGESAALIYTTGTFVNDNPKLKEGATSLAVQIWSVMSGEQPNFELASAISIVILVIVLLLNISVKVATHRLNRKWSV
jgi:phosphate transport system permease protein